MPVSEIASCRKIAVFPQLSGTCWFNALLTALFFSQHTKNLLKHKEKEWKMSMKLKKIFKDILKRRSKSYEIKSHAYMFFKVITPEYILEQLNKEHPELFNFDPSKRIGYFNTLYFPRLLEFLGVKDTVHLDAVANKDGTFNLYYSNVYNNYKIETVAKDRHLKAPKYQRIYNHMVNKVDLKGEKDLVSIRFTTESNTLQNLYKKNVKLEEILKPELELEGTTYINDALLLTNFNIQYCKKGHDIAGLTCEGERYIYNGWMRRTIDRAMKSGGGGDEEYPCEIMKYDWINEKINFCLNPTLCKLDKIKKEDLSRQVCFNTSKGERTYVLVNKKWSQPVPSAPLIHKVPSVVDAVPTKKCPEGKIVNPKTGRCVKIDGAIGKRLQKSKTKV